MIQGSGIRAAFDIGGTFTDVVIVGCDGALDVTKVPSVSGTIADNVGSLIKRALEIEGADKLSGLVHATTVGSNALLEGSFAKVGLLTTTGFRDELELRRETRPPIYDFSWERNPPLIARRLRREVDERTLSDGSVVVALDRNAATSELEFLLSAGVESVAICFFNSWSNPEHEDLAALLIKSLAPDLHVSVSHDVLREAGEYERVSTTCVNAALLPVVNEYLDELDERLSVYISGLHVMQSTGGLMTGARARLEPVRMIESGPAAGVLSASALARELKLNHVLAFDMGGTTVKGCLIEEGAASEKTEYEVGGAEHSASRYDRGVGYAVGVPSFDIVEAGAGGGSIAWSDRGSLHVGPRSAGASPGPACYQNGGIEPTVTDANVVLGYINPDAIAGKNLAISAGLARDAIQGLAEQFDLDPLEMSYGIHEVANAAMMRTLRAVTTERGRDARDFTMIAFGGSGPVHAAVLASTLGISRVVVPLHPGLFSALGLLIADLRYDASRGFGADLENVSPVDASKTFTDLADEIATNALDQGARRDEIRYEYYLALRYRSQSADLILRVSPEESSLQADDLARQFHAEHESTFGYSREGEPIKVGSLRVKSFISSGTMRFRDIAQRYLDSSQPSPQSRRTAFFGKYGELEADLISRPIIRGRRIQGPALIDEPDTSIVVPPDWSVTLDDLANVVLEHQ